jgi:hydrogenase expression/formation protein HypC
MCVAVPGKIIEKHGALATVDVEGNRVRADVSMVPEAGVGDYVMLHAGFAISKYTRKEAEETLALLREIKDLGD